MELLPGIHHFDCGPFNWYLIEQEGRLTLIDAGFPGHYRVFEKALQTLGKTSRDVEAIVLTHAHADHTGFAEKIRKESGAPVFVHTADAKMAHSPLQLPWFGLLSNAWRRYTATMLGVATLNGVFTMPIVKRVQTLLGGERLDIPGKPRILHTPGHTKGEIALLFEGSNALISGDTIVTRNLLTGAQGQPQLTSPILSQNYQESIRSLDLLKELGNLTLLPGHGAPWKGNITDAISIALASSEL